MVAENKKNYINNENFLEAMIEYKRKLKEAKENDKPLPQIPNYIGECFLKIAYKLTNHRWFVGYSQHYKEEMIGDAIENCIMYMHNFDPNKSKNPFAYFTQIQWFAFRRRLEKEKKHSYIKFKSIEKQLINMSLEYGNIEGLDLTTTEFNFDNINNIIENFEIKITESETKKKKDEEEGLELFTEDDEP